MSSTPLSQSLLAAYDGLSAQLRKAARFVLDHPSEVALLSMREQARRAGVQPATMTRLAQSLGFTGYDALREVYADALRGGSGFAAAAGAQIDLQQTRGAPALAAEMLGSISAQVTSLAEPETLQRIVTAATLLAEARRVYVMGLRSSHGVAWQFHYILSLISEKTVLLDGTGGAGPDPLRRAEADDVVLVVGVRPYTRAVSEAAHLARAHGVPVVALTDSLASPLAQDARAVILTPTASPSFFHAMTPAFALAEVLAALIAGASGEDGVEALRGIDAHLAALNTFLDPLE